MKNLIRFGAALLLTLTVSTSFAQATTDSDGDGIADSAEVLLGTNPQNPDTDGDGIQDLEDPNPTLVEPAPQAATGTIGFKINDLLVENNYDTVAKKDADDHLEILLENTTQTSLSGFSVYFTITDLTTQEKQSYLVPLTDFSLNPGETKPIHIDLSNAPNHYAANPNSMLYTSQNERQVEVMVMADGYASVTTSVKKDAGGAETAD
jgi:hypothetical protein